VNRWITPPLPTRRTWIATVSHLAIHTLAESSIITGHNASYHIALHADATNTVHEMHFGLCYTLPAIRKNFKRLCPAILPEVTTLWLSGMPNTTSPATEGESITTADTHAVDTGVNVMIPLPFVSG
jgi:hypothetical protein